MVVTFDPLDVSVSEVVSRRVVSDEELGGELCGNVVTVSLVKTRLTCLGK